MTENRQYSILGFEQILGRDPRFNWVAFWNAADESPNVIIISGSSSTSNWSVAYEAAPIMAELLWSGECCGSGVVAIVTETETYITLCVGGLLHVTIALARVPRLVSSLRLAQIAVHN
ncbi:MAG: hypothetical protein ACR2IV_05430 [Bryobacteraceae bacterium]